MNLAFDYLVCSDAFDAYILDGSLSISLHAPNSTLTMDMLIQSGADEDVYWINNYRMTVTDFSSYLSMTISGRFYDPAYGYVTVSTPQSIDADYADMVPGSGELLVVGSAGAAGGPTMAKLTFSDSGVFSVAADTNGDGLYNWDSGERYWSSY